MAIILSGIRIGLDQNEDAAVRKALKKLNLSDGRVKRAYVSKTSLDARRRNAIALVNTCLLYTSKRGGIANQLVEKIFIRFHWDFDR